MTQKLKLKFKSIDEVFREAEKAAEAAFVGTVCSEATRAVDEKGQGYAVYFECYPEQVALFQEALRRFPQYTELYAGKLGELYFNVEDVGKAVPYLEAAISAEPISKRGIRTHLPLNHNMLAIIYLTQKQGEKARDVLIQGKERSSFRNTGTDALLAYAYLLSGNPPAAIELSDESLDRLSKLHCPDSQIMAHNLAAAVKGRVVTIGSDQAVREYQQRMGSLKDSVRNSVIYSLNKAYGTTEPLGLVELTPTTKFEHLKWLKYGSYQEPID